MLPPSINYFRNINSALLEKSQNFYSTFFDENLIDMFDPI